MKLSGSIHHWSWICCCYLIQDLGIVSDSIPYLCYNINAFNTVKNQVQHKRTKHTDVRHHFLRDDVEKGTLYAKFYKTEDQVFDIFTKALHTDQFEKNRLKRCLMKMNWVVVQLLLFLLTILAKIRKKVSKCELWTSLIESHTFCRYTSMVN